MSSFLGLKKKKTGRPANRLAAFLLALSFISVLILPLRPAQAQFGGFVTDIGNTMVNTAAWIWDKTSTVIWEAIQKAGSIAFQRTLSSALNKIAYDAANYIGSGGKGQKPLFVTQSLGDYLLQAGDEAAGTFIESFVNNLNAPDQNMTCQRQYDSDVETCSDVFFDDATSYRYCITQADIAATECASKNANSSNVGNVTPSFNVCSPSSIEAKIRIGLGLVDQTRPQGPNCTASQMIKSWGDDINKKISDLRDPNYLNLFTSIFDPRSNDVGIYVTARSDLSSQANFKKEVTQSDFITNKGFLDVRDISGAIQGVPGEAQREADAAAKARQDALGKTTGDILVDSANIFLNQLYIAAFNNLLQNLAKKSGGSSNAILTNPESDPGASQGTTAVKQLTTSLLQPKFGVRADYDILSSLAICPDPKNPGPDNCVMDDKFMQAITEKKTVAEAIREGYLHGDWQITADSTGDSYNRSYALRNLLILRKYRILPAGWEAAAQQLIADPEHPKKATLNDLVSCFDRNDQYNSFSADFLPDRAWCEGLVDPNWVLKAPLNYCKKEGVGAQIIDLNVIGGYGMSSSTLSITRADGYCADNQTCIKEKSDGSCEAYGYCTGEKRTWAFDSEACEPINNTCQSFSDASGRRFSYLKNTLDYAGCNSNNAGCRQYALVGAFATSTQTVAWSGGAVRYFNKTLGVCSNAEEGCTALLRLKPTWGANLVMNSNFGNDQIGDSAVSGRLNDWPVYGQGLIVDGSQEPGGTSGKVLQLSASSGVAGLYSDAGHSLLPANFQIIAGQSYTVSADVYLAAHDASGAGVKLNIGSGENMISAGTTALNRWQHLTVTMPAGNSYNEPAFSLTAGAGAIFYVQNLKFEMSDWETAYTTYGAAKFYERLLPPYLEKACYVNATGGTKDYNLRADAPAICGNYARKCNREEVGCELYTSVSDRFSVGAKTTSADYCQAECLGYDVYVAKASYFNIATADKLIPAKATDCRASAAGCNEFTNLDALNQGGEQKEYYTQLKQCIKPDTNSCANFYSWEGTASGYQLKAYSLKKSGNEPAVTAPEVTGDGDALCDAAIYHLPASDPRYNPDCREFYNAAGQVSYHLNSRTYTCSDDCHTYRMTAKNAGNVCLNGGTWDAVSGACIYKAIPGEGQICRAEENGCREYNGNNGSNVRLLASYDFENGAGGWFSPVGGALQITNIANNKDGHSLLIPAHVPIELPVSRLVRSGSAYTIKFLARSGVDTDLRVYFQNPNTSASTDFSTITVKGGNEWRIYQANLPALDHAVGQPNASYPNGEVMFVGSDNGDLYLDNFILSEIVDRYYLIQGSSQVPDACYYDNQNRYQGADFNLGCAQYTDRNNLKHNLHRFTQLCSDSAVGCEQMIDTKNYSPYGAGFWEKGVATSSCDTANNPDCVKVEGDSAIYAVYDQTKLCTAANQGCSRLGEGQGGANFTGWSDVFKNNNPDNYDTALCSQANVGCEAWQSEDDNTTSYFKNPGSAVCAYRTSTNPGVIGKRWFKVPVKRCDVNGNGAIDIATEGKGIICSSDSNCGSRKCLIDNNDYECPVTYTKTIGFGGAGGQIPTPLGNAGQCTAAASGCTEYIDPVTKFAQNLVENPGYETVFGNLDGWGAAAKQKWNGAVPGIGQQAVKLEPYKLYSAVAINASEASPVSLNFLHVASRLGDDNLLAAATSTFVLANSQPVIFDALNNSAVLITGGALGKTISLKELAVDYQLKKNIDKSGCQGQTKFDNGCILFNERAVNGAAPVSLNSDAYATPDGSTPVLCSQTGSCTANQLIKVRPDRVCARWLDCVSYTKDPDTQKKTCYAFGECDRLDDKGECADFLNPNPSPFALNPKTDQNASGYSLAGHYDLSDMVLAGRSLDQDFRYDFESGQTRPDQCSGALTTNCVIDNPDLAGSFGTDYPAHGLSYLKVGSTDYPLAQNIVAKPASSTDEYFISYLVNTKDSGGSFATITFTDQNGSVIKATSSAPTGWQRKVQKLNFGLGKKIMTVALSSTSNTAPGPVYFDDISIAPVLKMSGGDDIAAPECRLYPSTTSLTCENRNQNVVSDGLEGYCLQYDPANPKVCLLWYPMDNIPLPSRSVLGYDGNFPLNFCTAVSGNFALVEKRVGYHLKGFPSNEWRLCGENGETHPYDDGTNDECTNFGRAYTGSCGSGGEYYCPADYDLLVSVKKGDGGASQGHFNLMCVPKKDKLLIVTNSQATSEQSANGGNWETCQMNKQGSYHVEGYGVHNGFQGCEGAGGGVSGCNYPQPSLRIYDYSKDYSQFASSEAEAKLGVIPGLNSGAAADASYFHFNCTNLIQAVEATGANNAWVQRNKADSGFVLKSSLFVSDYGQALASPPFGAASIGRNVGDGVLPLRDRALPSADPYAGRPYGCVNGSGTDSAQNCKLIGVCSNDANTYCLATSTASLSTATCKGGTCQALWKPGSGYFNDIGLVKNTAKNILKYIFLSAKNSLVLDSASNQDKPTYTLDPDANFDFSRTGSTPITKLCNDTGLGPRKEPTYQDNDPSFCAILPKLTNVRLYFNDSQIGSDTNPYIIEQKGIYRLELNSEIDDEQQPLKRITIDWGDGYSQTVTNQDHHPTVGDPHTFYHYYYQTGPKEIRVRIVDNWSFYKCNYNCQPD
ncbi:MAG: hypothetical protein WC453_00400 [Patescibacteria group bacterium]